MNNFEAITQEPKRIAEFFAEHMECSNCICKEYCEEHYDAEQDSYCAETIYDWFMEEYKEMG